ncbi:MAG: phospholipase D-like domain-containing protein [Bacteroides sp.]|nr:phospholipase D-like domain-containing protein [Bacteroides sp.]
MFDFLLNTHRHFTCKHLLVSPYYMRDQFVEMIEKEMKIAAKRGKASIFAKFNSLTDEKMIRQLYKASQAGVKIRLIVRGSCILQPGVPGMSENIEVISIVDKYLEHARLIIFHQGGAHKTYIGSADWITRNLERRVEVCTPVLDEKIKRSLRDYFDIQWRDNVKARIQDKDGKNQYVPAGEKPPCRSQEQLYNYYKKASEKE